jgi:hypothetical protein
MKNSTRIIVALLIFCAVITWTACSSDGYTGTTSVYVGHGYGGYGPGWGHGWGGYGSGYGGGYYPPPVVIGPPMGGNDIPVAMPF